MTTSRDLVREYDLGYRPKAIRLQATSGNPPAKQFEWTYTTDLVGNILEIQQPVPSGPTRVFGYQDWQYFLTSAQLGSGHAHYDGRWRYDRVGNRIEEEKATHSVFYGYLRNAAGTGNTSKLLGRGPELPPREWQYSWDAGGYLDLGRKDGPGGDDWKVDFSFDGAGQLGEVSNASNNERVRVVYDGRGFLRRVEDQTGHVWLEATYSDDGTLHSLLRTPPGQAQERIHVLYFAGNPIAIWRKVGTGASTMTRLITDHLGTPVASVLSNGSGVDWIGGFTPWGEDWQRGTSQDSLAKGIFLRLPGQWKDPAWSTATYPFDLHYNLHRWYDPTTGRYISVDPLGLKASLNRIAYVDSRPLFFFDPLGLLSFDSISCGKMFNCTVGKHCCCPKLEEAVRQYNEFFSPGWRERNPKCWKALSSAGKRSNWGKPLRPGQSHLDPLSCVADAHRDEVVRCRKRRSSETGHRNETLCGITDGDG